MYQMMTYNKYILKCIYILIIIIIKYILKDYIRIIKIYNKYIQMDNNIITEEYESETAKSTEAKVWICKRCEHESSSKCNLLKHLRRKTPCVDSKNVITIEAYIQELLRREYNDKTYDCQFCSTKFNAYQNRHRHYKTCKEAKKQNKDNIIKELQEENNRLKEQLNKNVSSQNIVNNIINNINITINSF